MERSFMTLIYQYMELDPTTEPSQEIFVNPVRLAVPMQGSYDIQTHIDSNHQAIICISRENVTGGIYKTLEFERELLPMELIIGKNPIITPLERYEMGLSDSYMDILVFSKK